MAFMIMLVQHLFLFGCFAIAKASNFNDHFDITWGGGYGRAKTFDNGKFLHLYLDKASGSGFQSKKHFLFSKIDMQIKLISGHSAGTVTTFYMSSSGSNHDEIDFEFLGNETGQPYTLHTNVYSEGEGSKEQQFRLWFDPTKDFHTYSILWNPHLILLYVDGTPIRAFKNKESSGVPFPNRQQMKIYASLWDAEDWATQGGRVKTDWSKAPFITRYGSFNIQGASNYKAGWMNQKLDSKSRREIKQVRDKYMIYDYCNDKARFRNGLPLECKTA